MKKSSRKDKDKVFQSTLRGVRVLDFSRLLPGPYATTILKKMGAEVTCIVAPLGDELLSSYSPFKWVCQGKKFIKAHLKQAKEVEKISKLIKSSDVLVEGFRPGVMDRLGLGFKEICKINPHILFVSISGFKKGRKAGHDLNFLVESGLYAALYPKGGATIPRIQIADVTAGYLVALKILNWLYLPKRQRKAKHLHASIEEGVLFFQDYLRGSEYLSDVLSGGLARYQIYFTKDKRRIAMAGIEQKFYEVFLEILGLSGLCGSESNQQKKIAQAIRKKNLKQWKALFKDMDACVSFLDESC